MPGCLRYVLSAAEARYLWARLHHTIIKGHKQAQSSEETCTLATDLS